MTTRTTLRRDLADLRQKVYELGEKCIEVSELHNNYIEGSSALFEERMPELYSSIKKDVEELHNQCFLVLTLQQPLIKDLRFVIGSLQVVLNLEKISEQFNSTAQIVGNTSRVEPEFKDKFVNMNNKVHTLLVNSLMMYLSSSTANLKGIKSTFEEINLIHDVLYKGILSEVATTSGEKAQVEAQLLSSIRSIEKVADLSLNISEQVNYIVNGREVSN